MLRGFNSSLPKIDEMEYSTYVYSYIGSVARCCSNYGEGVGPIRIGQVECQGSESSVTNCYYERIDLQDHLNDVGVQCFPGDAKNNNYLLRF